jgi:CubicO group peptidase (beta-lactamase class C family)
MRHFFIRLFLFAALLNSASAQSLYFPPTTGNTWDTMSPLSLDWCQENLDSFYTYLAAKNTKAFIVLKDGKIVVEQYFNGHSATSTWQWASAGKTITSFLVGVAQQEQFLNINDSTSKYLGAGWTSCTSLQEKQISIKDQLCMTSGLDDGVIDPFCTAPSCLQFKALAGTRWAYHNGPYTLLDSVIQSATGSTLNMYANQKLKTPTGMTGLFIQAGDNNVFFSTARSMARFGLLILNKGNWNGNQLLTDTSYFNAMVSPSQTLNKSYGYLWWLNGKASFMTPQSQVVFPGSLAPSAPADMISGIGKDGQFVNIVPSQNLVVIRMGENADSSLVPFTFNDSMWARINNLQCPPNSISTKTTNTINVYPNPSNVGFTIASTQTVKLVSLYNSQGMLCKSTSSKNVETHGLANGVYTLVVVLDDGRVVRRKVEVK